MFPFNIVEELCRSCSKDARKLLKLTPDFDYLITAKHV
jgi:hypothetical protein